jgi:Icc-related predicted phosphoesterase
VRLLLVADLHYTLPQYDWVVHHAAEFDVVVVAGDHLDVRSAVPLDAQSVVMLRYAELIQAATRVVFSSGGHGLTSSELARKRSAVWRDDARAAGLPTDGDVIDMGDTLITVCPSWDDAAGRAAVRAQLARDAERRPERWIWVYHWPPLDVSDCLTGDKFLPDPGLLEWIHEFQPDVVLAGHVHQSPFEPDGSWADRIGRTWVFNPGRQIGGTPARVEVDFDAGTAVWDSVMGYEERDLNEFDPGERTGS